MKLSSKQSIYLLFAESALTKAMLLVPIIYVFWSNELGLSQAQIGLLQGIFAFTMVAFQIPTGYLADRFSHKASNTAGDLLLTLGAIVYFFANSFFGALAGEVLLGIGFSLSSGADSALLRFHCAAAKLDYKKYAARLTSVGFVAAGAAAIYGASIGAEAVRKGFLVQAGLLGLAGFLSLFIANTTVKYVAKNRNIIGDLKDTTIYLSRHSVLVWRIFLGASLFTSTLLIIWFLTPLFFSVGIDLQYHGFLFAAISVAAILGSEFSTRSKKLTMQFPFLLGVLVYLVLGMATSIYVIGIYLLLSFARGINSAKVIPFIQEAAPEDLQASAVSLYGMIYKLFSGTLVIAVNFIGNNNISHGLIASAVICAIMYIVFTLNKHKWENIA